MRNYYRFVTIVLLKFCFIISLIPLRSARAPWSQAKYSPVRPSFPLNNYKELYSIALHRMTLHFVVMYGQIDNLIICFIVFHAIPLLEITVFVLILWTLIHKFARRNKRDVNPSSVSVTRFIRSKFSRWNEKGFSPASTTIQWQSLNHMENQYHDTLLQC